MDGSGRSLMFAHGFGCDQKMWRFVAPHFRQTNQVVLFDHAGAGASDLSSWDPVRYASLEGYADDVVALGRELGIRGGVFIGHSVSAMIGVLASIMAPDLFDALVLVAPSPRYIDDGDYIGGFSEAQIEELLDFLEADHMNWSRAIAPIIIGNPDRADLEEELAASFCRTDPTIARHFARVTFTSDNRRDLPAVPVPSLVLQCASDAIAPEAVGRYVAEALPKSRLILMKAAGHCPHLSAPGETIEAIRTFL